jgi:hypothetical protein
MSSSHRARVLLLSDPAIEITDIAEKVQLSRERVSRALGEPHVTAYIQRRASRKVARLAAKGAARMEQLLAKAKSEQVQYRAAEFVLEASGIARANQPQVNVNIDVKAGYVIDLSPADEAERQMIERQAKIVGGGAVIDATAEPVRGIGPGGRKPD